MNEHIICLTESHFPLSPLQLPWHGPNEPSAGSSVILIRLVIQVLESGQMNGVTGVDVVGLSVATGLRVGALEGLTVGLLVMTGPGVGNLVGLPLIGLVVGALEGLAEGLFVGSAGLAVGKAVTLLEVGLELSDFDGLSVTGLKVGALVISSQNGTPHSSHR